MEPIVDRVKKKYKSQLREFQILDIQTDNGKEKVEKYRIAYTPTFIIVDKDDKEIDRIIGGVEQQVLERFIDGNIKRWKKKGQ